MYVMPVQKSDVAVLETRRTVYFCWLRTDGRRVQYSIVVLVSAGVSSQAVTQSVLSRSGFRSFHDGMTKKQLPVA